MEFEQVADYDPERVKVLQWMPEHDYLLHILALKRRSEKIQSDMDKTESGW